MRNITEKQDGVGDTLSAGDFNSVQGELEHVIESADITLDNPGGPDVNLQMLAQTIAQYATATFKDTGSADAYVLSRHGNLNSPIDYFDGMKVQFRAENNNTGASTVNVNGLGIKDIARPDSSPLQANDILEDTYIELAYNAFFGDFELITDLYTAQTLSNKTIDGDDNTISNLDHGTEVDDPSSGVHGAVGSIVGTTDAQTLTNKTLTSVVKIGILNTVPKGIFDATPDSLGVGSYTYPFARMTTAEMENLTSMIAGAYIFNTTVGCKFMYNGSAWIQLGQETYLGDGTDFTISSNPAVASLYFAFAIPYQTIDGKWRLRFNLGYTVSTASRSNVRVTISGVTFKSGNFATQAVAAQAVSSGPVPATGATEPNSGDIYMFYATQSTSQHYFSGDVELVSKPPWAK